MRLHIEDYNIDDIDIEDYNRLKKELNRINKTLTCYENLIANNEKITIHKIYKNTNISKPVIKRILEKRKEFELEVTECFNTLLTNNEEITIKKIESITHIDSNEIYSILKYNLKRIITFNGTEEVITL